MVANAMDKSTNNAATWQAAALVQGNNLTDIGNFMMGIRDRMQPTMFWTGLTVPQFTLLAIVAVPFILTLPADSIVRRALYPLHIYILLCAYFAPKPPGASSSELYNLGLLLGTWTARIIHRVYMYNPQSFRRKKIDDEAGAGLETRGMIQKFWWALELIGVARGIGWNWQVGGIPAATRQTRRSFVWVRLRKTMMTFFLIHVTSQTARLLLRDDSSLADSGLGFLLPILRSTLFLRFYITTGWLTVIYGHVTLPENLFAILLVGLGLGGRWQDPSQWPPHFGDIKEAYSLRRCWGKFWHAALRSSTSAPGDWLMARFPAIRHSRNRGIRFLRRYFLLFLAFFVSGLIHACGSYMVTRDSSSGISDGGAFLYFMVQPMAILIEDSACYLLRVQDDGNPSQMRRLVGYFLVVAFWLYAFPSLKVNPLARAHGLRDAQGDMIGGVMACAELAEAMPFNPVKSMIEFVRVEMSQQR